MIVTFGVRNCKIRGVLIETIDIGNGSVYFFKYQNQAMTNHCIQIQNIMRAVDVKKSRKVQVDITDFCHEYYDPARKTVWFRGIKLDSSHDQINRTFMKRINIDVGVEKRKCTIADTKAAKDAEKKKKVVEKNQVVEQLFQQERAKRIAALLKDRKAAAERMDCNIAPQ